MPPTTRLCSPSSRRLGVGYGRAPARIEVGADRRPLGGPLRRPGRDARARLGAPARPLPQRPVLRARLRSPRRATGWLAAQSISYVALPDAPLDYSAKAEAMLLRAARPGPAATCAKSGARRTGACSRCARAQPLAAARRRSRSATHRLLHAARARARATTWCASASRPTGRSRAAAAASREAPGGWTRGEARGPPGALHVVIDFSLAA